jgi:adenylate cyclase
MWPEPQSAIPVQEQRLIKTFPRKGFRFVGDVLEGPGSEGAVLAGIPAAPLKLPDKPSIAVLPFANLSSHPEQEYFADRMVEDITTVPSRSKSLFVIARNSSFTYKGQAVDIKQVGRKLGVHYVLEGRVARHSAGDHRTRTASGTALSAFDRECNSSGFLHFGNQFQRLFLRR